MSTMRNYSLQPIPSTHLAAPDVERNLGRVAAVLHVIAHTLASTEGLMTERWAPELRSQTLELRRRLAEILGEPALGGAQVLGGPISSMRQRARRRGAAGEGHARPETELGDAVVETLIDGIDVPRLTDSLGVLGRGSIDHRREIIAQVAPLLDTSLSLFDVVASREDVIEVSAERVRLHELLEQITRRSWSAARYRRATLVVSTEPLSVVGDRDLLRRMLQILLDEALAVMPPQSTLDVSVYGGRAVELELSFTGRFRTADPTTMMAGRELEFVRLAVAAHGGKLALDERGGRTSAYCVLPRSEGRVTALGRAA